MNSTYKETKSPAQSEDRCGATGLDEVSLAPPSYGIDIADHPSKSAPSASAKRGTDEVVLIRINVIARKVTFATRSGTKYTGTVDTDLDPGIYKIVPVISAKRWNIPGTAPGLRFDLELDNADPWTLPYAKTPRLEVLQDGKDDVPLEDVLNMSDTVKIEGDPSRHPNYIQNVIKGVGIFGLGGPFRLDRKLVDGMGVDSLYMPRSEFNLADDPLKSNSAALNSVYKTREAANRAVQAFGIAGAYTYYIGEGNHIYPTIISDTTAPALCEALRQALEVERTDAKALEKLSIDLLLWYVGARFPIKTRNPSVGTSIPRAAAGGMVSGGERALVFVEIGAGDLKASIQLAKKGAVKVIAVDPVRPAASALKELEAAGGTFVEGTAETLSPNIADHVFQYFPWRIGGSGSFATGGTWRVIADTLKVLKPGGAAHFVTEDFATAEFLSKEASSRGIRVVITETTAGAAAPGAAGAGVPGYSASLKVWLVNIYK